MKKSNNRTKLIVIAMLFVHVVIYLVCRLIIEEENENEYNLATKIFLILALVIKLVSDFFVFWIFALVFRFFLQKKR
jgi:hypothetical protein